MHILIRFLLVAASMAAAVNASASQFYVFPVKEIEGLGTRAAAEARPLVDRTVVNLMPAESQRELLRHLVAEVAKAYPASIVHARQVGEAIKGRYRYADNDNHQCNEGFVAPIASSYALTIGVTRASYYVVDRGPNVELLIPITLNLQLIKPERGKVAYSISETVYSPFLFTRQEYGTPQASQIITRALLENTSKQISLLLQKARSNFNPKQTPVKLVGSNGNFYVADKGFETGFQPGHELEAVTASGKQVVFRIVSADSGYAVLRPIYGSAGTGEEYLFTFETAVDDSRKPKLMPVTISKPEQGWTSAVADLFAKDIGFQAPFQIAPVDVNFSDTMNSIRSRANCVPWDKYPSSRTVSDSRVDAPNFFLRFERSESPVTSKAGIGGVKTVQSFISAVSAQVVDNRGNVIFSELGYDNYDLEKVGNQGLSLVNAQEVAMKNATAKLASNFLKSVKLTPLEFQVERADKNHFWVSGLPVNGQPLAYEVLRPLGVEVGGKKALMKLEIDASAIPPAADGNSAKFAYSISAADVPAPEEGDIVRILSPLHKRLPELSYCGAIYRAPGSMPADFLAPVVSHVAYSSPLYQVSISDPDFYADANLLLTSGFYKFRLPPSKQTEQCFKPGYKVAMKENKCEEVCSATFLNAASVIVEKAGQRTHQAVQANHVSIDEIPAPQLENFIGLHSMKETLLKLDDLSRKFNSKQ